MIIAFVWCSTASFLIGGHFSGGVALSDPLHALTTHTNPERYVVRLALKEPANNDNKSSLELEVVGK